MLRMPNVFLAFVLFVATVSDVRSQPAPSMGAGEQTTAPDQHGTSAAPFVVTATSPIVIEIRTPQQATSAIGSTEDFKEKAENDRRLVRYSYTLDVLTGILAVAGLAQVGIFIWQGVLVMADARRTKILERAYLWPGPGYSEPSQNGRRRFFVTVHNTGKTTGVITDVYYKLSTEEEFKAGGLKMDHYQREDVIPPDMGGSQKLTGASVELIGNSPKILHGYILYTDVFKKSHKCPWKHWLKPDGNSDPLLGCYSEWD